MPWKESTAVSQRLEFVMLARKEGTNVRALCRRFGISSRTGYKWIGRHRQGGAEALGDRSRRPQRSPRRSEAGTEASVLEVRGEHPAWGGRKIRGRLIALGVESVPAASTVTAILHRHGKIDPAESEKHAAWTRFEQAAPNELWQMDFKGHVEAKTGRCHPLTVLDDHSRYCLGLRACGNERGETVRTALTEVFERYGLPRRILSDNGPPWGVPGMDRPTHTELTVWLLRLGIGVTHGRPYHPQTQGKEERFHRTLNAEVLSGVQGEDLPGFQHAFDRWREVYNHERPHEALGMTVPSVRYRASVREMPRSLPPIEYGPEDRVRKVQAGGEIHYRGRTWAIGKAFRGEPVGLRATTTDGVLEVYYGVHKIGSVDQRSPT